MNNKSLFLIVLERKVQNWVPELGSQEGHHTGKKIQKLSDTFFFSSFYKGTNPTQEDSTLKTYLLPEGPVLITSHEE